MMAIADADADAGTAGARGSTAVGVGQGDSGRGGESGAGSAASGGDGSGPAGSVLARATETPRPVYPTSARRRAEQGTVRCRIHVRDDGTIEFVEVLVSSGSERLDRAAVDALTRWRFEPALRRGEPIASLVDQEVRFALRG
jgi:protein TonB